MDALSATLRIVRLKGAIFLHGRFTAPWCYASPPADLAAPHLEPSAERVVIFHMLTHGQCWVELEGRPPLLLIAGDAVLFPQGDAHRMGSEPGLAPDSGARLERILARRPRLVVHGGGGAATHLVCGYLGCDARLAQLMLAGLPPVVKVGLRGTDAGVWLEASLRYALAEARSPRPGGEGVLGKLAEVLFIEVLRSYVAQQGVGSKGWLMGVSDRIVGAALRQMHESPAQPWTLETLARAADSSRSVLAERFSQLVGTTPMQYLTQWRMLLASNLLCRSNLPLVRVAEEVGYETDTAFSRAFRREFGMPPATWRRQQIGAGPAGHG
jgi:AraC-like DNA-binding protein